MLLVLVVMYEEEPLALPGQLDLYVLLGTCFLAFGIGITCFQLQARVHATSIATANVASAICFGREGAAVVELPASV